MKVRPGEMVGRLGDGGPAVICATSVAAAMAADHCSGVVNFGMVELIVGLKMDSMSQKKDTMVSEDEVISLEK